MTDSDDLHAAVTALRDTLARLNALHAAELADLRARHAAVVDALTNTYRGEIARLTAELAQRKETS